MNCFIIMLVVMEFTLSCAQLFYAFDNFDSDNNDLDRHLPAGYYYINDGRIIPISSDI